MKQKKDKYDICSEERKKCRQLLSLWLIVKDNVIYGRILVRWPQKGRKISVTMDMWPREGVCSYVVYDYELVTGCRDEAAAEGIAKMLIRKRHELKTYYNLDVPDDEDILSKCWQEFIEFSGYKLLTAI